MTTMTSKRSAYHGYRFPAEIISHAVWLYHRFSLSFRDVEDLLAERGITVTYEAIRQWCRNFGSLYARRLKRRQGRLGRYGQELWIGPDATRGGRAASSTGCVSSGGPPHGTTADRGWPQDQDGETGRSFLEQYLLTHGFVFRIVCQRSQCQLFRNLWL